MNENPGLFLGTLLLLIVGGNDTTRNSISGRVAALNEQRPGARLVRFRCAPLHG